MRRVLGLALTVLVVGGVWIGAQSSNDSAEPAAASSVAERGSAVSDPSARFGSAPEKIVQKPDVARVEAEPAVATGDLADVPRPEHAQSSAPTPARPRRSDVAEPVLVRPDLESMSQQERMERWGGYDYDQVREIWAFVDGQLKIFASYDGFRALHFPIREDLLGLEPWSGPLPEPQLRFTVIDGSGHARELSVGEWWISDGLGLAVIDEGRAQHYLDLMSWRLGQPGRFSREDFNNQLAARIESYRLGETPFVGADPRPHAPMPTPPTAP